MADILLLLLKLCRGTWNWMYATCSFVWVLSLLCMLKSASNLPIHYRLSLKSSWQWSNVRTLTQMNSHPFIPYPPRIPRSVATLLEVMVCACYFCTGSMYTLKVASLYNRTRWEFRKLLEMLMLDCWSCISRISGILEYSGKFCLFHS